MLSALIVLLDSKVFRVIRVVKAVSTAEPRESHAFCTRFYSVFGSVAGSLRMAQQQLPDAVRLPRLPHMHSADSS